MQLHISQQLLRASVLILQLPEPLRLINFQAGVFLPPLIVSQIGGPTLLADLSSRLSLLRKKHLGFEKVLGELLSWHDRLL